MYLRSCPGFSSASLLFLVYGFSRRAGTTPVVVGGGGSYVRDSVTIYFMAHALREDRFERETTAIRYEDEEKACGAATRYD